MKYSFKSVDFIEKGKDTDESFVDAYRVSLLDERGLPVLAGKPAGNEKVYNHFYLDTNFVENAFKTQRLNWAVLPESKFFKAIKQCSLECELIFKTKGAEFVALTDKGLVNVSAGNAKPVYKKPEIGKKYKYQETGITPNYDKDVSLIIPEDTIDWVSDMIIEMEDRQEEREERAMLRKIRRDKALTEM